ncbi:MAG: hypothetical protein ABSE73_03920 [Planctomycetota bacterium]
MFGAEEHACPWQTLLVLAALLAVLSACWVIPLRLGFGAAEKASFYNFGFIGDEYGYAERCQPLLSGATATNPINGVCDENCVSQLYLEDSLRALLTLTGWDVLSFFRVWRAVFPLLFLGALGLLVRECLPPGGAERLRLRLAAGAAAFISVYLVYDLVTVFPPLQGFVNRVPTNLEYLLSALTAWVFIRLIKKDDWRNGVALAALSAATVYARPYATVPWGLAVPLGVLILLVQGRLRISVMLAMLGTLAVLLSVWIVKYLHNRAVPVEAELWFRCFGQRPYSFHERWPLFLSLAAAFAVAAWLLGKQWLPLTASAAATMAVLPFVSAFFPFGWQLLIVDRYGVYYLLLLPVAGLLVLSRHLEGRGAGRWPICLALLALCGAAVIGTRNARYDFAKYDCGPYESISQDLKYLPAYKWVRENTPPGALFLVDDGCDWSGAGQREPARSIACTESFRADLFLLAARRRRVYHNTLYMFALSDSALSTLKTAHSGTFGGNVRREEYFKSLRASRPDYVFWRKDCAAVPRGLGRELAAHCDTVYEDPIVLIWKLGFSPDF